MKLATRCLLVAGATALVPTKVQPSDCCSGESCLSGVSLQFPETVYPVTPRFDFNITGSLSSDAAVSPEFRASGSLGLPNHPLGIFGFKANGTACGERKIYVEDGILAVVTVDFPPCPWAGDVLVQGHVDVWTTIPAVPLGSDGLGTGFSIELRVTEPDAPMAPEVRPPLGAEDNSSRCQAFTGTDCATCRQIEYCNFCTLDGKCDNDNIHLHSQCRLKGNCVGPKCATDQCPAPAKPNLVCLNLGLNQPGDEGADPAQDVCNLDLDNMPEYPPKPISDKGEDITIPYAILDLDVAPRLRWDHIVRPRAKEIATMVDYFADSLMSKNNTLMHLILDLGAEAIMQRLPDTMREEMEGIALSTGLDIIKIFVYNIMYEVEGLCTSMISQDASGNVYHSRNLDFGLFMGDDADTHNWKLTEMLRPLLLNVQVARGGQILYNMTQYAGYVGLLTGSKPGGFSLSVDTRFDAHIDEYLVLWLLGKYDGNFLSMKTREVMETLDTYDEALESLSHYRALGPCYIIMGGAQAGEGAVITLGGGSDEALMVRHLKDELVIGRHYVLQTNYDWPGAPPAFDDRRYPAIDCMNKLGAEGVGLKSLWGVMSSNPNKNAMTTYTALMSAQSGHFEAYQQFCTPGPDCMPFLHRDGFGPSLYTPLSLVTGVVV